MRIRGLGVIEDAVLELAPGLTVVSGETGAGKTMVVTGLGLLFGGRADPGAVRPGVDSASVEGRLRVDPAGPVAARAAEAGAELDDDVLTVLRTVSAAGRSRAHLGGRSVPAGILAELADSCLAVHGQSDQSRLLQPAHQRDALDRYAGAAVGDPLAAYRRAFDELRAVGAELDDLTRRARERAQEADLLRFGLDEIEAADPQPGETTALRVEEERLGHADGLRAATALAQSALLGETDGGAEQAADASALVAAARAALEQVGVAGPGPGRAGGPAARAGLPAGRPRRRRRVVRRLGRDRPGPAGRGAGAAGRAVPAGPQVRRRQPTRRPTRPRPSWPGASRPPPG